MRSLWQLCGASHYDKRVHKKSIACHDNSYPPTFPTQCASRARTLLVGSSHIVNAHIVNPQSCTALQSFLSILSLHTDRRREASVRDSSAPVHPKSFYLSPPSGSMSDEEMNPAAVPVPVQDVQGDGRWMSQICFTAECKDAEPEVLFVGDSMVQLMQQQEVWRELFSPLHVLNFGIGGDTTCNVLWRLQNGELQNIRPKVVVVWVGTNNHEHTAEQVAGGILAIAQLLTSRLPRSKVVVLGLLPRGERPNPLREKNAAVNALLRSWLPRLDGAQLLDVGGCFVHSDGTVSPGDMFDFLHLTAVGYRAIAKPLSDLLMQLLEEMPERRASLV
ncbi:hypothetical protein AGOR_G00031560 [Albula goreensis]|uniref:Platelet-activating factor acetylhydrolase IB subunit alpha2 n=1 Tax=Albula goreensis TaxID=1534307 RepID=A0A8T3E2Z9_9TELE|nr:hypothetical protein AGOR_G00031560 [Albula goreensis]